MQKTSLVEIKTADWTVTAQDSGKTYIVNGTDLTCTLPATVAGLNYRFIVQAPSATTGFSISPAAADSVNAGTDNKDLINSAGTDAKGDAAEIWGDGSVGWFTSSKIGTWAEES